MAESNSPAIRAIAWFEVFPWLNIARAFRLAIAVRSLVLGAVGILLTVLVWGVIGLTFGTDPNTRGPDAEVTGWLQPFTANPWAELTKIVPDRPGILDLAPERAYRPELGRRPTQPATGANVVGLPARRIIPRPNGPISRSWTSLSAPAIKGLSHTGFTVRSIVCLILCGLWGAAVWAFFGAAICRTAAVRLAADEQVGMGAALRYASRKWPAYFAAPLLPVCGVVLATIPVLVLGWIMRSNPGLVLGGVLWPLVLVAAFLMAVLLLGLLFGWPLMWAAISAEGTDSFDALSRTYAYVFQRPLRYSFYIIVAGVIGWLGWILVREFAAGVVWLGYWAAGWGCGQETIASILNPGNELSDVGRFGAGMIRFWAGCVKMLAVGYCFSYFWTASTAVYFLLRRDVDATEMDEVFLDADAAEQEPAAPSAADNGPVVGNGAPAEVK